MRAISGEHVRIKKAAELYHAGYADKVLLTTALAPGIAVKDAESYGISRDALLTENKANSIYECSIFKRYKH
ncbi:hypothetical protein [Bacillus benzoevorans]|uniref:Uncharacterized SAM-binding protein YcdF (DUF218 family) n=1 Tax=Bacillus benzoevorans TaxID=1456 RepID=A0A7X0LW57_9BACI|nr:uncharacterized SAM-binding protein YcdF (DUF218 family) [Bacillus benzoevorans]